MRARLAPLLLLALVGSAASATALFGGTLDALELAAGDLTRGGQVDGDSLAGRVQDVGYGGADRAGLVAAGLQDTAHRLARADPDGDGLGEAAGDASSSAWGTGDATLALAVWAQDEAAPEQVLPPAAQAQAFLGGAGSVLAEAAASPHRLRADAGGCFAATFDDEGTLLALRAGYDARPLWHAAAARCQGAVTLPPL